MLQIRRIKKSEGHLYQRVRLAALADSPHAFSSTLGDALLRSNASWEEQAEASVTGNDRATFFALNEGIPIGLAAIYRNEKTPQIGDLIQVWLCPAFRGTGLATQLIHALLDWAQNGDFKTIQTEVTSTNQEVLPFYLKLGFLKIDHTATSQILELQLPK